MTFILTEDEDRSTEYNIRVSPPCYSVQPARGCVVAMCAAPCIPFGRFNAFLLPFQTEESKGTATTVKGEPWGLLVEVPSFTDEIAIIS